MGSILNNPATPWKLVTNGGQLLRLPVLVCIVLFFAATPSFAANSLADEQSYYLRSIFGETVPPPETLWMKEGLKKQVADILQHTPGFLRARYWSDGTTYVWVLNEVGKTQAITFAVRVAADRIEGFQVLAFRESRGWEIKHDFYTEQFIGAGVNDDLNLDKPIDGITGATLSVRASKKVAQMALLFTRYVHKD